MPKSTSSLLQVKFPKTHHEFIATNSVHAIQSIYEKVTPGADEQEHTTPIVSLCHGIFAE